MMDKSLAFRPFDDARIRKVKHNGVTYYSLVDICEVITGTDRARKYWTDTKKRLAVDGFELSERIGQFKMPSSDGKMRLTDCADAETCLRIVQSIPHPAAEPVRQWFTNVGIKHLQSERHQAQLDQKRTQKYLKDGKPSEWIEERLTGIVARKSFTAEVQAAIGETLGAEGYQRVTNGIYGGLFDRTARMLRQEMALPDGTNVREHLPGLALTYVRIAETVLAEELGTKTQYSLDEACQIIDNVARAIGQQVRQTSALMRVDIATGKRMLKGRAS